MKLVTDVFGLIGMTAILYVLATLLRKLQLSISNKRRTRLEHIAQSGTLHLDVLGRMDDLEASTKQHIRDMERKVRALQEDFDTVGNLDRDIQNLAAIVNVQRGHIEALQAAVKLLNRRITRLRDEVEGHERLETVDEEYAAL